MNRNNSKINVLITSAPLEGKGGIVALHQVLFGQPVDNDFDFILFPVSSPSPFQERLISRVYRIIVHTKNLCKLFLKDKSIKVIHINTSYDAKAIIRDSLFIIISSFFKKKIVLQIHSAISAQQNPKPVEWIAKHIFPLSDKILVYSKEDWKNVAAFASNHKAEIFPNAIIVDQFANRDRTYKSDLRIPEEGKVILFLSRLIKSKGVYDFIEAIPLVTKGYDNAYFLIAGEGPEKEQMESQCQKKHMEKTVRFTGHIQDNQLIKAFSCADIFVLPTYHAEGMPMAILQALAAGLPIISTRFGSIPDIIEDNVNGFLVEPHSPEQVAEKILLLLRKEDIKKRMEDANRKHAINSFDVKIVLNKLEKLYLSL